MVPKVYTSLRFPLPLPWNTFWPRNPGVRGFDYDPIGLANALDTSAEFEILRIQNLWQCVRCWFRVPRSSILIYFYAKYSVVWLFIRIYLAIAIAIAAPATKDLWRASGRASCGSRSSSMDGCNKQTVSSHCPSTSCSPQSNLSASCICVLAETPAPEKRFRQNLHGSSAFWVWPPLNTSRWLMLSSLA